jgi:NADPH-dependent glutamate synthase beta subunit-like oxidoreductase/NAD(P)H-flavin reductase
VSYIPSFDFNHLQTAEGLLQLQNLFINYLDNECPQHSSRLQEFSSSQSEWSNPEVSTLILDVAPYLERFLASMFGVQDDLSKLADEIATEQTISHFKKDIIQKKVRRYRKPIESEFSELDDWLESEISYRTSQVDQELTIARFALELVNNNPVDDVASERMIQWCVLALKEPDRFNDWASFHLPSSVDHAHLVTLETTINDSQNRLQGISTNFRQRHNFALTDNRMSQRSVQDEINYCVYCHEHEGDFCSIGFPEKKKQPELGPKRNPLGVVLTGCPLEEKISEMHLLKKQGKSIAALAVAMIDNPMIPATGHRICNDCMKACVYQKKDPVNIPQAETRILTDILDLPWGVEIYDLLCRWNPLRKNQSRLLPDNGKKVLVAGLGPAGFTMVHHLTMEGCAVLGIDGLKIEPLPENLLNQPVKFFSTIKENLDQRTLSGFGGVAEYGITVRWDKNFLKLIYLTLARRKNFRAIGGVRFGGTLSLEDAEKHGFDHVCVATGAGLPRVIPMGHSLARGMRQASDFLMALQLTGAAKDDSLANLQIRMPAIVIGGGLTAVDTATEVQVYYIKQVRKILKRFEEMESSYGRQHIVAMLDLENQETLDEFLHHGRELRDVETKSANEGSEPDYINLVRSWGGVTVVYRKGINESPAYQRNHEELIKALEEGIYYAQGLNPSRLELDKYDHVSALVCNRMKNDDGRWLNTNEFATLPAKSVLVAAGTLPNTIYESEHPGSMTLEGDHFLPHVGHREGVQPVQVAEHSKAGKFGPFTSYDKDNLRVSFIGDTHPVFNGSVVNAIASASRSYPQIMESMSYRNSSKSDLSATPFLDNMRDLLSCRIISVKEVHPMVLEIWIHAPMAARNFKPGQFFRMQTFESSSERIKGTLLQIPLQTVSGAGVRGDMIRLMLLKWGANARIAERLQEGDPLVLMGPTGEAMEVEKGKTFLVISGTWGAAVMLGLGPALRAAGNQVIYIAAYADQSQVYSKEELEASTDMIIWAVGNGEAISPSRPQDCSVVTSDMVQLIRDYADNKIGPDNDLMKSPLTSVDEIMVMGSTGLLKGMQSAFKADLGELFHQDVKITGTVGSPMQCMMKGVCGQCLQWQIDPESGERTRAVFSCAMQDQPLMWIDLDNLAARQGQTKLQEHLTMLWVDHILKDNERSAG